MLSKEVSDTNNVNDKTTRNYKIMEEENKRKSKSELQITSDEEKRTVEGYALLFETPSDGLGFTEKIERGALDGVIEKSDVFALLNHSSQKLF